MKRIVFVIITVHAGILFSCQQSEFEFSCDPVINEFVLENREELSKLPVTTFGDYELPLQKAVYNSWDAQKKREAWIGKLQHVISSGSFAEPEILHLQKLTGHIHEDYFLESRVREEQASRKRFADEWINYAVSKLGWSDQYIAFLVYRLYTEQYQFEDELSILAALSSSVTTDSETSCTCNTSSDFCIGGDCASTGCSTISGCGWLWTEQCNGVCN
jgi:hypothetical protein